MAPPAQPMPQPVAVGQTVLAARRSLRRPGLTIGTKAAIVAGPAGAAGSSLDGWSMPGWLYALLIGLPLALASTWLGWPPALTFASSALGLVPLAGLIGRSTEQLAHHLGPRTGGLLNATFGNATELIITTLAIRANLLTLVKASITGSIIGNLLLVLGSALLAGGLRHGRQSFEARPTSVNAAMMILAIAGLYLPALFGSIVRNQVITDQLSLFVAGVLLLSYVAYLVFTVFLGQSGLGKSERGDAYGEPVPPDPNAPNDAAGFSPDEAVWSLWFAVVVLAAATVGAALASELLVRTVEPVTAQLGWSEFFVGVIIVPIIGNAAEHFSAVQMAWRDRVGLTLAITTGSSTQIALLVAPLLVFLSLPLGHRLDLVFTALELAILGLATTIFAYISLDGESNWLEGFQLLALYAIAGFVFFFLPLGQS
jgi:Ca2+:H+ antiporter